jgi:N-acetylmuramoyl-L-alanine amidase
MSAGPTRIDSPAPPRTADPGFPLDQGNRVIESLARQETLRTLLAFSALHEQIQNRRAVAPLGADWDLFQTERFVLDEVLQLVCDRTQALTGCDGVMIALAEGASIICRASCGPLLVERGVHLVAASEFLQDAVDSGRILRCDDCQVDTRVELDLCQLVGARSTVLVPLRGLRAPLGVLQAFARAPLSFTDDDVRCFDLFAELVLSALKPEDQDRRLNWLADVADEILRPKVAAENPCPDEMPLAGGPDTQSEDSHFADSHFAKSDVVDTHFNDSEPPSLREAPFRELPSLRADRAVELPVPELPVPNFIAEQLTSQKHASSLPFLHALSVPTSSRPGLNGVVVLVLVAALFSAGVWWGMRTHGFSAGQSTATPATPPAVPPSAASRSSAPSDRAPSDHLLDPTKLDAETVTAPPASESRLAVLPRITSIRHWASSVGSTVVIDMEDQVPYEVHRLSSPERIYFDLHDTALTPDLEGKTLEIGDPSLTRVRVAQPLPGVTRVVLDTKDGSNFAVSMESSPYRLVVELRGSERTSLSARLNLPAAAGRAEPKASALSPLPLKREDDQLAAKAGRFRIVLDPGHGGWDLGTVGRQGLLEKDLVLDVSERLGRLLRERLRAEVVFTRTSDAYLPLDQRAEVANQIKADLFVSVHANYSDSATARGVETYYTNFFSPPGAREIEARENGTTPRPAPVSLSAGELHEKIEESRHLAASIQRALYATLAASNSAIRDRGVKDSAFAVLTGTTMPAVLTEISFVSSPADERNLGTEAYRQRIAEALYKGIARYEASAHHVQTAQVQPNTAHR